MAVIWEPTLDATAREVLAIADALSTQHFEARAAEIDRDQRYPWENVALLVEHGLSGVFLPREHGGRGASLTAAVAVTERIGMACSSTAAIVCALQLGAFPILLAGRPDQKAFYLAAMVKGIATSFALSERHTGSDAAAIATTATPEGDGYRLRGEKYWIGNGEAARYYIVFAKTDPDAGARGISAFVLDKQQPGVVIDEVCDKMGIRGTLTTNLRLDCHVAREAMVGAPNAALRLAFRTLDVGRIMVAAQALGLALAAYREAAHRAVARATFGRPIIENQGIGFMLADMATEISAARMMLYDAAAAHDRGADVATPGAMAKLFCSEVAHRAVDRAVQIWGGYGFVKPIKVERLYRDQRIVEIYEGTSEIQRLVLARAVRREAEGWRADRPADGHAG